MPRKKFDPADIRKLEQKFAKAQSDLRHARSLEKKQVRADDARRKIISGALNETHALTNPKSEFAKTHVGLLKQYVKPEERYLFTEIFRALLPARDAEALLAEGETAREAAQAAKKKPANTDTAPALPEVAE